MNWREGAAGRAEGVVRATRMETRNAKLELVRDCRAWIGKGVWSYRQTSRRVGSVKRRRRRAFSLVHYRHGKK